MLTCKKQRIKLNREDESLLSALKRIDEEKPNRDDVAKVKEMLMQYSDLWEKGASLLGGVLNYYIERIEKSKSQRLFIEAEVRYVKEKLGYFAASQIEKLLIDQILLNWVIVMCLEKKISVSITEEKRVFGPEAYWQKILIPRQNRYLKTIETLVKVRMLSKRRAFQVNIATNGGQQVNVNEIVKKEL